MKKKEKEELENKVRIAERTVFLNVYDEFNKWLHQLGFRSGNHSSTIMDNNFWTEEVESLHSVEHYTLDVLKLSVRFMRDRYKHVIYSVGGNGILPQRSDAIELETFKADLLTHVKELKEAKIKELNAVATF